MGKGWGPRGRPWIAASSRVVMLVAVVATMRLPAQSPPPVRPLGPPEASLAEPFSRIGSLRELADGRVLVTDVEERRFALIDLARGRVAPLLREGGGPAEFRIPFRVLSLPADSSALFDPGNRRYLVIDPRGVAVGEFRVEQRMRGASGGTLMFSDPPRAADARGRIYIEASRFANPAGTRADSVPILRFDRAGGRFDTVAVVGLEAVGDSRAVQGAGGVTMAGPVPFAPRDEWAAAPDGRVFVVRTSPFRIEVYRDGSRVTGPTIPYAAVRVGAAEQAAWRERMSRDQPTFNVAGGQGNSGGGTQLRVPEPSHWPDVMPPFHAGAAWASPAGELWLVRATAASVRESIVDIFDGRGARRATISLPEGTTIAGFGRATVYLVRTSPDGEQFLQRHRLP